MSTLQPSSDEPSTAAVAPRDAELAAQLDTAMAELSAATGRLLTSVRKLTEDAVAAPSRLPRWSRGHVLTHIARNADGLGNLLIGLRDGVDLPMYPSAAARDQAIEDGAGRPVAEHLADLEASAARFAQTVASVPISLFDEIVAVGPARIPTPAHQLPFFRIREVQIHHVDLGVGFAPDDWPKAFAVRTLDQLTPFFRNQRTMPVQRLVDLALDRAWVVADDGPELSGSAADLASWLIGRSTGPELAVSDGSPVPTAPDWV